MDISSALSSPMTLIGLIGGGVFLVIYLRFGGSNNNDTGERKIQQTRAIVFLRDGAFFESTSDSFDGLVTYGLGGFVESRKAAMFLYFGRPFSIFKQSTLSAKKRVGIYMVSINDPMPMNPLLDSLEPDELDVQRYEAMKQVTLAREVDRGKRSVAKRNTHETMMAATALVIGIVMALSWLMVIILPLTDFVEKS